jgi:SAM-dependent methyltransferase
VPPLLSPVAASLLTFLAAASVLVLEIAAARLLAPYVGVTITTYTAIIGVILAGIAAGAWAGGRAADELGPHRLIGPTFVLGGLTAVASVPIVAVTGAVELGSAVVESLLLAALGFVAPATILSAVAPMIVRATLTSVATSGSLVGRLSAVATAGAITGTFLTGFLLLGLVPTPVLIVATGLFTALVGLGVSWRLGRSAVRLPIAAAASLLLAGSALASPTPCEVESRNYCIRVVEDPGNPAGRTLVLDGLNHAYVDVRDPSVLRFYYIRRFADVAEGPIERRGGSVDALHVGGGGFSFPRYLEAKYPGTRQTVLELDPGVLEVARSELGLRPSNMLGVLLGDARSTIRTLPDDSFDLVLGDAFGGLAVPWHLTTREFLAEIDRVLRPSGRYVMNVIDYPPLRFVRAEAATARVLFAHVAVVADPPSLAGRSGGNFVVVASHQPIEAGDILERIERSGDVGGVLSGGTVEAFIGDARVLTDDFAPVDQLLGR